MERDDVYEYSLDGHHSEEEGKKIRTKIKWVTIILTLVTSFEVMVGIYWNSIGLPWMMVKITFIVLTVYKAGLIVMVFMHLGDERKSFKLMILAPYIAFILYLIWVCMTEALYFSDMDTLFG